MFNFTWVLLIVYFPDYWSLSLPGSVHGDELASDKFFCQRCSDGVPWLATAFPTLVTTARATIRVTATSIAVTEIVSCQISVLIFDLYSLNIFLLWRNISFYFWCDRGFNSRLMKNSLKMSKVILLKIFIEDERVCIYFICIMSIDVRVLCLLTFQDFVITSNEK